MTTRYGTGDARYSRRAFLRVGSAGLAGLALADVLRQEARGAQRVARARSVILLWLGGGPATIDLWDLKPAAPDNVRGEFQPIPTRAAGVSVCEHLPMTAKIMDRCLLIRSLHHTIPAHGPGTVYMATGHPPSPALERPALGALAARLLPAAPGVPPYVLFQGSGFTGGAGFLGPAFNPFEVEGPADRGPVHVEGLALPAGFSLRQLDDRNRLRDRFDAHFRAVDDSDVSASLDRFQRQALDVLRSDRTRRAFDVSQEKDAMRNAYGRTPFGQGVLAARRLVEAGVRFVTVGLNGWDTHAANFATLRNRLLPQLDRALPALVGDLDTRGLLTGTIVYCAGEFGRTPLINGMAGRDHWARSMAVLLAGGGLRRGYVHGSTDPRGMAPATDPCAPADVAASLFHALGIEPTQTVQTPSGRPVPLFRDGQIIEGLFA